MACFDWSPKKAKSTLSKIRTVAVFRVCWLIKVCLTFPGWEELNHPSPEQVLSEQPPISKSSPIPKLTLDFAQYYVFDLTIFALTILYSSFAPLVVPVAEVYFGYRYAIDKYNFLFVYRVQGFPAGSDGRLMDTVLCIMRFCMDLFLLSMLLFFSVQGGYKPVLLGDCWRCTNCCLMIMLVLNLLLL